MSGCVVNDFLSGVCSRGTRGCRVEREVGAAQRKKKWREMARKYGASCDA